MNTLKSTCKGPIKDTNRKIALDIDKFMNDSHIVCTNWDYAYDSIEARYRIDDSTDLCVDSEHWRDLDEDGGCCADGWSTSIRVVKDRNVYWLRSLDDIKEILGL